MPVTVKVTLPPAIRNWPQPINDGLEAAGAKFKQVIALYPPQTVTSSLPTESGSYRSIDVLDHYVRTKHMAATAAYKVSPGSGNYRLDVGGVKYMSYVLNGTGIYGHTGQPIKPRTAKVLAWKGASGWHFASSVRGMIWSGKLAEVKAALVSGFVAGFDKAMGRSK
jgi:hypothetical protein